MPNINDPAFDAEHGDQLGVSLLRLEPGTSAPVREGASEAVLVVLEGTPTVGDREVPEGEVVALHDGDGIANPSSAPVRVLVFGLS